MPKAEIVGWLEVGEKINKSIPTKCPKCGKGIWKTDVQKTLGYILVGCKDSTCRWCCEYSV